MVSGPHPARPGPTGSPLNWGRGPPRNPKLNILESETLPPRIKPDGCTGKQLFSHVRRCNSFTTYFRIRTCTCFWPYFLKGLPRFVTTTVKATESPPWCNAALDSRGYPSFCTGTLQKWTDNCKPGWKRA